MDAKSLKSPAAEENQKLSRSALMIVFLVVFIDLLGFGIVVPLLPLYGEQFLEPLFPKETHRALQGVILGLLMSSFSAMQFLFAPIWGGISDHKGRRPILLLGLAGSVFFYALFGVASEFGAALGLVLLFLARLGAGVAGATIATAQAVIADSTTSRDRAGGMALIGAAFGIGFTFGPLLGFASLLLPLKGAPGFVAAGVSFIALVLAFRLLPETLRANSAPSRRSWLDRRGLYDALRTPMVGTLVIAFFLATFAFAGLESTLALLNAAILNPGADLHQKISEVTAEEIKEKNFMVFAYVGLILMVTQGYLYRRMVARVGEVGFLRIGLAAMIAGLACTAGVLLLREEIDTPGIALACAILVVTPAIVGFACLTPSVHALISLRSDPTKQGEVLGVNQSAAALARILGPMAALSLFEMNDSHVWPYLVGASLVVIVFLLALRVRE